MPGKKIDQRSQLLQHRNECRSLGLMSTPKLKSETRALIVNRKQSAQLGFKNARDKPPKRPQLGSSSPLLATISTAGSIKGVATDPIWLNKRTQRLAAICEEMYFGKFVKATN